MKRSKVYEFTGRKPTRGWNNKVTIRHAVYEALKELKRADVPKIVGTVLQNHRAYQTKQRKRDKQIRFTLWQFCREGIARERPDRRWRPTRAVTAAVKAPKKRWRVG